MRLSNFCVAGLVLLAACSETSPPSANEAGLAQTAEAEAVDPQAISLCPDFNLNRNVYYGDLHVHTSFSFDAYGFGTKDDPRAAYVNALGNLDFAAATDHAEFIAETNLCQTKASPAYWTFKCYQYRTLARPLDLGTSVSLLESLCKDANPLVDAAVCAEYHANAWAEIQSAANDSNQPCEFSALIGYEYSLGEASGSSHRNIIFSGRTVPDHAISSWDHEHPQGMWEELSTTCLDQPGCDVLAIPHNSNASKGNMFNPVDAAGLPLTPQQAALRAELERIAEVHQVKGNSECAFGVGNSDESCQFEQLSPLLVGQNPPRLSFLREGLKEGLKEQARIGVNPLRLGMIGSSDTHNATPGATSEATYAGSHGAEDDTPEKRLDGPFLTFNPGGLAGVWAFQNTRRSIFNALKRREVFGTSGTRLAVRFFAGNVAPDACSDPNAIENAYASGVPMGGTLSATTAPSFLVMASQDPSSRPVAELQVIKGWYDGTGLHEEVVSVATAPGGAGELCAVWTDSTFDSSNYYFYYVRAFEAPSPRWSERLCMAANVDCADPVTVPTGYEACCDSTVQKYIRERAWSSPIWYSPQGVQ